MAALEEADAEPVELAPEAEAEAEPVVEAEEDDDDDDEEEELEEDPPEYRVGPGMTYSVRVV